jgi:hypothetical protein
VNILADENHFLAGCDDVAGKDAAGGGVQIHVEFLKKHPSPDTR